MPSGQFGFRVTVAGCYPWRIGLVQQGHFLRGKFNRQRTEVFFEMVDRLATEKGYDGPRFGQGPCDSQLGQCHSLVFGQIPRCLEAFPIFPEIFVLEAFVIFSHIIISQAVGLDRIRGAWLAL